MPSAALARSAPESMEGLDLFRCGARSANGAAASEALRDGQAFQTWLVSFTGWEARLLSKTAQTRRGTCQ
jgi:hypothetical protein